ncbi:uncharacterized protein K02A2.6-like isoform X2 [Ornithodoros turicata]|uniref:uncharacterized protein K02A2.6-like isoform X2 n=1 Tax=Ornithodoros turicata TaxID=34597 RepID=UPI00313953C3
MCDESKKYLTLNTHKGLFEVNRLLFGIASAPGIFQRIMENVLKGLPKVCCYLDDLLITGSTPEEHLANLDAVLKRLVERGIRVKRNKCYFFEDSLEYLGHVISASGIHTSPEKVKAIVEAPRPVNKQQLRSLLGLVNYYGKFVPQLSTIAFPLNRLLCNKATWLWSPECEHSFNKIKEVITTAPVLAHYSSYLPLQLAGDASPYGVQPAPPKSPLHPWSWPTAPWHRLHADFAGPFKGHMFLIVMDAHSKWPEVFIMGKTTTKHTIEKLHELFSRFGIPESFVTDNGPQFVSQEFKDFLKKMGIRHVTTTPYHTSSNGLAERFVQSLKTALRKGYEFHQSRAPQLCGVVIKTNSGYAQAEPLPKRQSATTIQVPGLQHLRTSNSRIFPAPLRYSQQVTGPVEPCSDPALRNPFRTALEFHSRLLKKEDTLSETDVLPSVIKLISFVLGGREVSCMFPRTHAGILSMLRRALSAFLLLLLLAWFC